MIMVFPVRTDAGPLAHVDHPPQLSVQSLASRSFLSSASESFAKVAQGFVIPVLAVGLPLDRRL
ncbi:MAG: hypothetical protein MZU79_01460 [Anaerotruncus sp.]|nr:hypothetical protein [Anaerotruncus sp.]